MKDLIEALTILAKYLPEDTYAPTHCEHDVLYVPAVDFNEVSDEDKKRLDELGFSENTEFGDGFMSFRFGSC
jgi:hypothetical protein